MDLQKKRRIVDAMVLKAVALRPCAVCNRKPCDPHHIKTRGAGGGDTPENLVALCREHHTEIHQIGTQTFMRKYPHLLRSKMGTR